MKFDQPPKEENKKEGNDLHPKLRKLYEEMSSRFFVDGQKLSPEEWAKKDAEATEKFKVDFTDKEKEKLEENRRHTREKISKEWKEGELPEWSDVYEFVETLEIDVNSLIQNSLDGRGNIVSGREVFEKYLEGEIVKKFKLKNIYDIWYSQDSWIGKEIEYRNILIENLKKNLITDQLERMIALISIREICYGGSDFSELEVWDDTLLVVDELTEIYKKENLSVLEKVFTKTIIYELVDLDIFNRFLEEENDPDYKKRLKDLRKEIGRRRNILQYNDESFNSIKIHFEDDQRELIVNDAAYTSPHFRGNPKFSEMEIEPIYIDEQNYTSGEYINTLLAPDILGVYTRRGRLVGVLDLREENDGKIKDVFQLKYVRQNDLKDIAMFKLFSSLQFRGYIDRSMGIDISNLSLPIQFNLLGFIQDKTKDEIPRIQRFIGDSTDKKNRLDKIKAFLSIEHGGKKMGEKILILAEKFPSDISEKIFSKYAEIIDAVDKAEGEVEEIFTNEDIPKGIFGTVKETLLKRGVEFLSGLADRNDLDEKEIFDELEDIKTSAIIMGSSYVELYKEGIRVPIEDIKNTSLEVISGKTLSAEQKTELLKAYEHGRPKETYENKEHLKLLLDEFRETLEKEDTFVFNIRFEGKIIAFATFYKENEDTMHIGGLTFLEDVRNPAFAVAVMNSIMDEFGKYNIKALVHSKNKILPMYQKRFGFKITGELPPEENAGELYYSIERPKDEALKKAA